MEDPYSNKCLKCNEVIGMYSGCACNKFPTVMELTEPVSDIPLPDKYDFGINEVKKSIRYMRKRWKEGQGQLYSAMCRLSLPMSEYLFELYEGLEAENEKLRTQLLLHTGDATSAYLTLKREQDQRIRLMNKCKCGSYAINDDPNQKLCDKCWRDAKIQNLKDDMMRILLVEEEEPGTVYCITLNWFSSEEIDEARKIKNEQIKCGTYWRNS